MTHIIKCEEFADNAAAKTEARVSGTAILENAKQFISSNADEGRAQIAIKADALRAQGKHSEADSLELRENERITLIFSAIL